MDGFCSENGTKKCKRKNQCCAHIKNVRESSSVCVCAMDMSSIKGSRIEQFIDNVPFFRTPVFLAFTCLPRRLSARLAHLSTYIHYNCMFYLHLLSSSSQCISFYFISFPFIRFYMDCFDFIFVSLFRLSSSLRCPLLKCVIPCTGLLFSISIFIPFHFLFIVLFCFVLFGFLTPFFFVLFCFLVLFLFLSLCITCSFDFVIFDVCVCVHNMHPFIVSIGHALHSSVAKSVESVCASDNQAKPFNNNIKYSLIRFALSRCTNTHIRTYSMHLNVRVQTRDLLNKSLLDWSVYGCVRARAYVS